MAFHPIQLAQTATARGNTKSVGTSAKDAQVINGVFEVAENPLLGTKAVYVAKRGGSTTSGTIGSTGETVVLKVKSSTRQLYISDSAFNLYDSVPNNLGAIGGLPGNNLDVCESLIDDVTVYAFAAAGAGWFLYEDAITKNFPTFSASLTSGQATVVGLSSTGGIYDGQLWSGSGIPASTRVSDVLDSSRILLSQAVTESGTKTVTKEAVAKIIDTTVSNLEVRGIETMDGYFFLHGLNAAGNKGNRIYQSALNDPATWASSDFISADLTGDSIRCIFRIKDYIVAAGSSGSIQYFYNAGNATGSILSPADNLAIDGLILHDRPVFTSTGGYFLASDVVGDTNNAMYGLYRITGVNQITKLSDVIWSEIISRSVSASYLCINAGVINGRLHIILNISFSSPTEVSVAYDTAVNQFWLLQLASGSLLSSWGVRFTKDASQTFFLWSVGNVWTDSDAAYTMTIQTEPQDMAQGLDTTDTWADLLADVESSGTMTIDVTDDNYGSWVNKGSFDMTKNKKRVSALGFHQGPRAYRLQHSANTGARVQILRINHQPSSL